MYSARWTTALAACAAFFVALGSTTGADQKKEPKAEPKPVSVDSKLLDYKEAKGVSGGIKSAGSDTMKELMENWGDAFRKHYPSISVEIEDKGSATAPPALINNQANFGAMSREMKQSEIKDFQD